MSWWHNATSACFCSHAGVCSQQRTHLRGGLGRGCGGGRAERWRLLERWRSRSRPPSSRGRLLRWEPLSRERLRCRRLRSLQRRHKHATQITSASQRCCQAVPKPAVLGYTLALYRTLVLRTSDYPAPCIKSNHVQEGLWCALTIFSPAVVLLVSGAVAAAAVRLAVAVFVVIPVPVRLVAAAVLAVALLLAVRFFHGAVALARVQLRVQQIVPVRGACQASVL